MKTMLLLATGYLLLAASVASYAAEDDSARLQKGLFEEEANHNLEAAIKAYQSVVTSHDNERKLAATAVFRLGECYRKLGRTNDAVGQYQRVLTEFADQSALVNLSRQNLRDFGVKPMLTATTTAASASPAAQAELKRLLEQELQAVDKSLREQRRRIEVGTLAPGEATRDEMETIDLRRRLLALDGLGKPENGKKWRDLLAEEIALAEKAIEVEQKKLENGKAVAGDVARARRELYALRRELVEFSVNPPTTTAAAAPEPIDTMSEDEEKELRRVQALVKESPDLISAPLLNACGLGFGNVVQFLLAKGADAKTQRGDTGDTALHQAAGGGHKRVVEMLLAAGADVNAPNKSSNRPLHRAIRGGYRQVIEVLLAAGADVNARGMNGARPLHLAAEKGSRQFAEMLLAKGAEVDVRDGSGLTALHYAVNAGSKAVAELLLAKGAKIENPTTGQLTGDRNGIIPQGYTPLHVAVKRNNIELAGWLCEQGAEVNRMVPEIEAPPLSLAAVEDKAEMIEVLLKHKADLEGKDSRGRTALVNAVATGAKEAVARLLDAGASPNAKSEGAPAVNLAPSPEILRLLLAKKPDLEATNRSGRTILQEWCYPQDVLEDNQPGLQRPIVTGNVRTFDTRNIIVMLLEAGANVKVRYRDGSTLLHWASYTRNFGMAESLLQHGADINAVDDRGRTPLTLVWKGDPTDKFVEFLVGHGTDEALFRRGFIAFRRSTFELQVLAKGTNDYNRYTLYEFLVKTYYTRNRSSLSTDFPDLKRTRITRMQKGSTPTEINVDFETRVAANACTNDLWLEWGDVIDIPELEHPLNSSWSGFEWSFVTNIAACLKRNVKIVVKGRTNSIDLKISFQPGHVGAKSTFQYPQFNLSSVVGNSGLLLTTSDRRRLKVSRLDPITKQPLQLIFDISNPDQIGAANDLWLRDGDVIEVPELSPTAAR